MLTNAVASSWLVFHLWSCTPSKMRYFIPSCQRCCISFGVFLSGRFWLLRISPISSYLLCIPLPVLTQPMVPMFPLLSITPVLVPRVFSVRVLQLIALDRHRLLAEAPLPLMATIRDHLNLHSFSIGCIFHWNQTFISIQSSRWLVLLAGHWRASLVEAILC